MRLKVLTLSFCMVFCASVLAQNANSPDLYIYEYKNVIDTAKADSIVAAYNAAYNENAKAEARRAYAAPLEAEIADIDRLIEFEASGKKMEVGYQNSAWVKLAQLANRNSNVTEKEKKTIGKGKVPAGFTDKVLLPAKAELQSKLEKFTYTPTNHYTWNNVFKQYYYDREAKEERPMKNSTGEDRPMKILTIQKPNPECADNYFNGTFQLRDYEPWGEYEHHKWDETQQSQGWEWATIGNMQSKVTYFPEELSYWIHPAHQEYRFTKTGDRIERFDAYDDKGVLIRSGNIVGYGQDYEKMYNAVMLTICKQDFLANKYDINSAKQETLTALRITFGIEDFMDARFKKYTKMAQEARDEIVAATTVAQYTAAKKKQAEALNVLLEYLAKEREPQALNYIKQLKADHAAELSYLYKIERIDNTTFKLYFLNDKMECGCIALMKWRNKAPYETEYDIELQPCETIIIRK